jgi:hypothetical protein
MWCAGENIPAVQSLAAAGAGFLLAVLWFDLMFDIQARGAGSEVPEVRASIAAYYRRVTTAARPMNRLIALVMIVTIGALAAEVVQGDVTTWVGWVSLVLAVFAVAVAASRTVRNAVRLGAQSDPPEQQSALARGILRDHVVCLVAIATVVVLQVAAA